MTRKRLSETTKLDIANYYSLGLASAAELAEDYGVSHRTINRVLVKHGVNRPPKRKAPIEPVATLVQQQQEIQFPAPSFMDGVKKFFVELFSINNKPNNAQQSK